MVLGCGVVACPRHFVEQQLSMSCNNEISKPIAQQEYEELFDLLQKVLVKCLFNRVLKRTVKLPSKDEVEALCQKNKIVSEDSLQNLDLASYLVS